MGLEKNSRRTYIPYSGIWNNSGTQASRSSGALEENRPPSLALDVRIPGCGIRPERLSSSPQRQASRRIRSGRIEWPRRLAGKARGPARVRCARCSVKLGAMRRGVPTSFGALPLSNHISASPEEAPVWPHPEGSARGPSVEPLYRYVPQAVLADSVLHEFLALLDALRTGRSRERALAQQLLAERLGESRED